MLQKFFTAVTDTINHRRIVNIDMIVEIERFDDNDHRVRMATGNTIQLNNENMQKLYQAIADSAAYNQPGDIMPRSLICPKY